MKISSRLSGAQPSNPKRAACGSRSVRLLAFSAAIALAAPSTLALADTVHTVAPGETVSGIADEYGLAMQTLVDYNGINNVDFIVAGSQITIPSAGGSGNAGTVSASSVDATHVQYSVRAGDTLTWIAQNYGTTVSGISELNRLGNEDQIFEGELLSIPATTLPVSDGLTNPDARQMLVDAANEFGVMPDLVLALAWQESGWQQHVVSSAGAIGVMQVLPSTANWAITELGVRNAEDWRTNPRSNIRVGTAILNALINQAGGDGDTALAFYVQGWYSIEKNGWFDETHDYVASVTALRQRFN
jgi:LysM repeat protein